MKKAVNPGAEPVPSVVNSTTMWRPIKSQTLDNHSHTANPDLSPSSSGRPLRAGWLKQIPVPHRNNGLAIAYHKIE